LPVQVNTSETNQGILQFGFYIWLASLAIGWRQFWITTNLRIHPAEAIIWGLFALLLLRRKPFVSSIPGSLKAFMALSGVGLFTAYSRGIAWDVILAEFKAFLVIIPIIYVVPEIIRTPAQWRTSLFIIAVVTFYISLLGLIEYFVPNLVSPLQGIFFAEQHIVYSQQGFARAAFTFWGSPIVNVYLSMVLVPVLSRARLEQNSIWRLFLFVTVILCGLGIYIAGGRGSWLGASAALALYVFFSSKQGWLKCLLLLPVAYNAAVYILPTEVFGGLYATFDSAEYYDTSALERQARAEAGIELIQRNPWFGHGWGAGGWVHSDLIQIGANLGLPALVIFLIWYLSRVWRIYNFTRGLGSRWPDSYEYRRGLLAGLFAAFVSLAVQAIYVIPPLIIPLWFLLALADRLPALSESSSS
jgi:O-antigen ligase